MFKAMKTMEYVLNQYGCGNRQPLWRLVAALKGTGANDINQMLNVMGGM